VAIVFAPPRRYEGDPASPADTERVRDDVMATIGAALERARLLAAIPR
jgi:hypothetical protein